MIASCHIACFPAVRSTAHISVLFSAEPIGGVVHVVWRHDPARGRDGPSEQRERDLPHPFSGRQQGTQVYPGYEVSNAVLASGDIHAVGGQSIS